MKTFRTYWMDDEDEAGDAAPRLRAVAHELCRVAPALERAGENLARDAIVFRDEHVHIDQKLLHN